MGATTDVRYFHFLTGRKIELMVRGPAKIGVTQADQFIRSRPDVRLFLVRQEGRPEYLNELNHLLEDLTKQGALERIYVGRDFHAYRRPAVKATRAAASVPASVPIGSAEARRP